MQTVLKRGSIDNPLNFDVGLIQLSFIPVKLREGLHFSAFHLNTGSAWITHSARDIARARKRPTQNLFEITNIYYVSADLGVTTLCRPAAGATAVASA